VVNYFKEHGFRMLVKVCNTPSFLEELTGLDKLRKEVENFDFDELEDDDATSDEYLD
jgi:hypothetical protein